MKHCNKCDMTKPVEGFSKNKKAPDGLSHFCKECCRIAAKRYRQRPEVKKRQSEYQKQYVEDNREKVLAYGKAYREEHRDHIREQEKARGRSPEQIERDKKRKQSEYYKAWKREYNKRPEAKRLWRDRYVNDPEFRANHLRRDYERRAKIMGVSKKDREDTTAYMIMIKNIACYYCGKTEGVFHIDHVQPLARRGSHLWHNLVNACDFCNLSKNAKTHEEFTGKVDIRHYCMQGV